MSDPNQRIRLMDQFLAANPCKWDFTHMVDERPLQHIRLDKLRYRWQHTDLNPDQDPMRWKAYQILEFRLRNGLDQVLAESGEPAKLYHSIKKDGLKNPLIVKRYGDEYFCIVGNTRLAVLRGMASEDARGHNSYLLTERDKAEMRKWRAAHPANASNMNDPDRPSLQYRPESGAACDAWLSVPCIIAKQTDSWNDWTEARMFSAPVNESGESPIEERRHFERLKYALLYEEYGYAMGPQRLEALRRWFKDHGGESSIPHLHDGPTRSFLRTWLDVGCGLGETRDVAREFALDWRGAEVLEQLSEKDDVDLIWGVHELRYSHYLDFKTAGEDRFRSGIPFPKSDLVTCLDVMEHILPEDTDEALRELWRVTGKILVISISWDEEDGGKQIGAKLHINIHSKEWWVDKFLEVCEKPVRVFDEESGGATFEVRR